jgi:crotonobetainyl-CoA:carnitine CoA-transferase CaiB-like acyl-CoA transferase
MHLGPVLAAASREPEPAGDDTPGPVRPASATATVFRCAGVDEWCVIDLRDDEDVARLASLPGPSGGGLTRADLARWTAARRPAEVMSALQAAGVPAGAMLRWPDELTDPHLTARQSFRTLTHPLLGRAVPSGARVARFSGVPDPPLRPAPMPGEHTRDIARTLLRLDDAEIGRLARSGVLQLPDAAMPDSAAPDSAAPDRAAPDRAAPDRAGGSGHGPGKVTTHQPAQGRVP